MKTIFGNMALLCMLVLFSSVFNYAEAQTDTVRIVEHDTVVVVEHDTVLVVPVETEEKKKAKRKDEFILFAGPNYNSLSVSSSEYESSSELGYHFGFAYKRGKFFYWQLGARLSAASYEFKDSTTPADSASFGVTSFDVPITGGMNLLSATNRVLGIRAFVSAVPSFALSTSTIEEDAINSFIFYGQVGVGVSVAFVMIDVGYNVGFQDLITDVESKPGQLFVNLGFRF